MGALATASQDAARIWDGFTGKPRVSTTDGQPILLRHASPVNSVAYSPDGKRVVTAGDDNTARIWDSTTGALLTQPLWHQGSVNSASFSPDGSRVVTCGRDRAARVWDTASGLPVTPPLEHPRAVREAWFSDDGRSVISLCAGSRRTWTLPRETRDPALLREMSELLASTWRGDYCAGRRGQRSGDASRHGAELPPPRRTG